MVLENMKGACYLPAMRLKCAAYVARYVCDALFLPHKCCKSCAIGKKMRYLVKNLPHQNLNICRKNFDLVVNNCIGID